MPFPEQQIVEFALRKCGVVGTGQTASADDYAVGKEAMDGLIASLPLLGVSLPEVSAIGFFTTWPLDYDQITVWTYGFGYWVAAEIAPDFGVDPVTRQSLEARASAFRNLLVSYAPDQGPLVVTVDNI